VGDAGAHAPVRRQPRDVTAVEKDRAGAGCDAAADEADEGGLAGSVWTDDGADLAALQPEVDGFDRPQPAEMARQRAGLDQRTSWSRHGSHPSHLSRTVPRSPFGKNRISRISATPTNRR